VGNFKIEIEAVGGHGIQREVKQGETIDYAAADPKYPDAMAAAFVRDLARSNNVLSARIVHWPDSSPIVDNMLTGKREVRDFAQKWEGEPILQFFAFGHLPLHLQEVSRGFAHAAFGLVAALPRNAERSVALRKLLEAKDAAVRAALAN
jgi:hypothetical protein